jgi:hypothetical protein
VRVGHGADGRVDGVAAAAALAQDLPVLDPCDGVFDAGAQLAVRGQEFGIVGGWDGGGGQAAVGAVGQGCGVGWDGDGGAGDDDVVAVACACPVGVRVWPVPS